jgi:hypothetical protein
MKQLPTIGRIVHYQPGVDTIASRLLSGAPLAAMVTFVSDATQSSLDPEEDGMPLVNLTLFLPTGSIAAQEAVEYRAKPTPGCWSWPPRSP